MPQTRLPLTDPSTHVYDDVVVRVPENILIHREDALVAEGARGEVIGGRVAFRTDAEDGFTAAIERLTGRRVVAFPSAGQTAPGAACELFLLEAAPAAPGRSRG